jgi:hypothetical protein
MKFRKKVVGFWSLFNEEYRRFIRLSVSFTVLCSKKSFISRTVLQDWLKQQFSQSERP